MLVEQLAHPNVIDFFGHEVVVRWQLGALDAASPRQLRPTKCGSIWRVR